MTEKILVPVLGESITEATISKWLKSKGESISADEPIVELETDKVNLEVPSPINGTLTAINFKDGESVEVGAVLGEISEGPGDQKQEENKNSDKSEKKKSDNVINFEKEKKQDLKIFENVKNEEPLVLTEEEPLVLTKELIGKEKTSSQKVKVLSSFDKANTVKESKLIYETLSEGLKAKKSNIKENLGRASKATTVPTTKKPIVESNDVFARMQKLAGIK